MSKKALRAMCSLRGKHKWEFCANDQEIGHYWTCSVCYKESYSIPRDILDRWQEPLLTGHRGVLKMDNTK